MVMIREFTSMDMSNSLDYDVVDDMMVYMRNNPKFYRRDYFPLMVNLQKQVRNGEKINPKECLGPMIEKACESYCERFGVKTKETLLTDDDKNALISRIFDEEIDNLRNGDY
jgi:hypothetical protein